MPVFFNIDSFPTLNPAMEDALKECLRAEFAEYTSTLQGTKCNLCPIRVLWSLHFKHHCIKKHVPCRWSLTSACCCASILWLPQCNNHHSHKSNGCSAFLAILNRDYWKIEKYVPIRYVTHATKAESPYPGSHFYTLRTPIPGEITYCKMYPAFQRTILYPSVCRPFFVNASHHSHII